MRLDRVVFKGHYEIGYALTAWKFSMVFWLIALALVVGFVYLRRASFQPESNIIDLPLSAIGNFIVFNLVVFLQLTVESIFIWGDKPVNSLQDMTEVNLRPWILGHAAVAAALTIFFVILLGQKEMDTFIFFSAIPAAIFLVGLFLLGMLQWPHLFSFPVVTSAVMLSQIAIFGLLSIPVGLLVIAAVLGAIAWDFT